MGGTGGAVTTTRTLPGSLQSQGDDDCYSDQATTTVTQKATSYHAVGHLATMLMIGDDIDNDDDHDEED